MAIPDRCIIYKGLNVHIRTHTIFHMNRRFSTSISYLFALKEITLSAPGSEDATFVSSGLVSCSAVICWIWPIFQARKNHMHTAAATYMNPVKIWAWR